MFGAKFSEIPVKHKGFAKGCYASLMFTFVNPLCSPYVFENFERRQKEEPLEVRVKMENTETNGLGISLPGGKVEMYSFTQSGGLEYIGADNMGQVPKGQSTTLTSGRAFDVIGKRRILNYDRQRKSEEAVIEIQVTNARSEAVNIQLVEHINGDWIIKHESINYQKKDASTIQFPITYHTIDFIFKLI